jgi:hypothetical protein
MFTFLFHSKTLIVKKVTFSDFATVGGTYESFAHGAAVY